MHALNEAELAQVFYAMRSEEIFTLYGRTIICAEMNVRDQPQVEPYVEPLMCHLYHQVRDAGIAYDAVAAIPSGGIRWAEAYVKIAAAAEKRQLRHYKLYERILVEGFAVPWWHRLPRGSRVLVIDDTIGLGDAFGFAERGIQQAGCQIEAFIAPVALGNIGLRKLKKANIPVFNAFNSAYVKELHRKEELA